MSNCIPGTLANIPYYTVSRCDTTLLDGQLVPTGGSEGQVLGKVSDGAFDIAWVDAPSGPGSTDPALASRVTALEGQVQDLEVDPALALTNGWVLTYDEELGKWKSGPPVSPGNGNGDMLQSVYDTNNDGKVDDSEKLGGQLPAYYAAASSIPTTLSQLSGPLTLGTNAQLPSPPDPTSEATLKWSPGIGWIVHQEGTTVETVDFYSWFEPTGYSTFADAVSGGFAAGVSNLVGIGSFPDPDTNRVVEYALPAGFWFCYFIHEDDDNADDAAFGWNPSFYSPSLGAPQTLNNLGRVQIDLGAGAKWHRMWRLNFQQGSLTTSITVELGVT